MPWPFTENVGHFSPGRELRSYCSNIVQYLLQDKIYDVTLKKRLRVKQ